MRRVLFSRRFVALTTVASACAIAFVAGVKVAGQAQPSAARAANVTFAKDVAPIMQQKCQVCHQPNSIGPMPLVTYDDARKFANGIKARVSRAADAAVAHRQEHRHPRVQERSQPDRRAGEDDRQLGGRRRADGRSEGHAAADGVPRSERLAAREGLRPARSRDQVAALHARAAHAGQVVPADERSAAHRAALGPRDRDQTRRRRGPPHRAPRADDAAAAGRRASPGSRTRRTTCRRTPASSWSGPSARSARSFPPTPAS